MPSPGRLRVFKRLGELEDRAEGFSWEQEGVTRMAENFGVSYGQRIDELAKRVDKAECALGRQGLWPE